MTKIYLSIVISLLILGKPNAQVSTKIGEVDAMLQDVGIINNKMLFSGSDGIFGSELWITDGTQKGTQLVKDIDKGDRFRSSAPRKFYNFKNTIYFQAVISNPGILEFIKNKYLYKTDGTSEGTINLANLGAFNTIESFFESNGRLYFFAGESSNNSLWTTDGTESGTYIVSDFYGYTSYVVVGNTFYVYEGNSFYNTIFKFEGSTPVKSIVKRVKSIGDYGGDIVSLNNSIYFPMDDGNFGQELWKSDGTESGTKMVKNIAPRGESSEPEDIFTLGNKAYFLAKESESGKKYLFVSDGSEEGTKRIQSLDDTPTLTKTALVFLGKNQNRAFFVEIFFAGVNNRKYWSLNVGTDELIEINLPTSEIIIKDDGLYYFTDETGTGIGANRNVFTVIENNSKNPKIIKKIDKSVLNWNVLNSNLIFRTSKEFELYSISTCTHEIKINSINGTSLCKGTTSELVVEISGTTAPFKTKWSNNSENEKISINQGGNYTVEVTDSRGCKASTTIQIQEFEKIPVEIVGSNTICQGKIATLETKTNLGIAPFSYQWKKDKITIGANSSNLSINTEGNYSVEVTDSKGCKGGAENFNVIQKPSPNATISKSGATEFLTGGTVVLSVPIATNQTYQWLKDGVAISGATNNTYAASGDGKFSVTINGNGCSVISEIVIVIVILANELPNQTSDFKAFPNPVENSIKINFNEPLKKVAKLNLISSNGTIIKEWVVSQQESTLNLIDISMGVYYLQAEFNGRKSILKLVKNN